MSKERLPAFRYHPDPVATGSVIASPLSCEACGNARGYVYDGPVHARQDHEPTLCPWCVASGEAARKYDASFTERAGWAEGLPDTVAEEVTRRTPGFTGWRTEHWLAHHSDAAAFLGPCGTRELRRHGTDAMRAAREAAQELGHAGADLDRFIDSLDANTGPTAYLFRCLHCDGFLAYTDA